MIRWSELNVDLCGFPMRRQSNRSSALRSWSCSLRVENLESRNLCVVPDFSLVDVNPATPTHDQDVSPRDYLGRVSAWYFIHST